MKAKSSILTVVLSLFLASGLLAQDKYEYATVVYYSSAGLKDGTICISKPEGYEEIKANVHEGWHLTNTTPVLPILEKLNGEGWEIYSTGEMSNNFIFYLRKKKTKKYEDKSI